MAHVEHVLGLACAALLAGCWEDRGSCELWQHKLERNEEPGVAVQQLVENRCLGARAMLLSKLGEANLGGDILAALVALGQSPEAESAVKKALGKAETAAAAARQVVAWKLAAAEPELRAALADQSLALHHEQLLEAALAVAPAARWVGTLARELGDEGPTMERALAAMTTVDWAAVPPPERAAAALALTELASRDNVDAGRQGRTLGEIGRVAPVSLPDAAPITTRAAAGNRAALLALWCLGQPALGDLAKGLVAREGVAPGVRALALAILSREGDPGAVIATAPPDDALAIGLALAGGPAVVSQLEARVELEKGAARAAFTRALGLALPSDRLATWEEELRKSPSMLLRGIPDEPAVAAVLDLARRCGADAACHSAAIAAALPRLARLDAELAAARTALTVARDKAEAAVAKDAARAQELAKATGDLAAARQELEAIAARRDAAYAGVGEVTRKVAELSAVPLVVTWSLRRLTADAAVNAGRSILEACRGQACAEVRAWAAVASGDAALACRLEGAGAVQ